MFIYTYLLNFFSFLYLADATSISANYLKVQKPVSTVPKAATTLKVNSRAQCSLECLSRSCLCFSYDASLQECGIGNCLSSESSTSNAQEFFVSCNSNEGFRLFTSGSVTACVWVSNNTIADYATARNDCIARSANLYTIKTIDKLNILRDNFPLWYWVGLNDLALENTFRWEDDNTICDSTCQALIFRSGEPNGGSGNEDCTFYNKGLNDIICSEYIYYICEKNFV